MRRPGRGWDRELVGGMTGSGRPPPDPRDIVRLHVEALFGLDEDRRLVRTRGGAEPPRILLARTLAGPAWWLGAGMDPAVAEELAALCRSVPAGLDTASRSPIADRILQRLGADAPVSKVWAGAALHFPDFIPLDRPTVNVTADNAHVLERYLSEWLEDVASGRLLVACVEGGDAVALCCSVATAAGAEEAGVETHPGFRGRGHAAAVTRAWARAVRERGSLPLYSTSWENRASRALARKLGLIQYAATVHAT